VAVQLAASQEGLSSLELVFRFTCCPENLMKCDVMELHVLGHSVMSIQGRNLMFWRLIIIRS
jgi:hypothetical protein